MPKRYRRLTPDELLRVRDIADHGTDPLERIDAIKRGTEHWTALLEEAIEDARKRGITWDALAERTGVSRQALIQKFKVRITDE